MAPVWSAGAGHGQSAVNGYGGVCVAGWGMRVCLREFYACVGLPYDYLRSMILVEPACLFSRAEGLVLSLRLPLKAPPIEAFLREH